MKASDDVVLIRGITTAAGTVDLHAGAFEDLTAKFGDIQGSWNSITTQLSEMMTTNGFTTTEKPVFVLDEVEVSLGITAKGKVAFIAEAGAQVSIKLKLKKA